MGLHAFPRHLRVLMVMVVVSFFSSLTGLFSQMPDDYNARVHTFIDTVANMAGEVLNHASPESSQSENIIVLNGNGMVGSNARAWRINTCFSQKYSRALEALGDGTREIDCHALILFYGPLPGGNTQDTAKIRQGVLSYVRRYCRDIKSWAESTKDKTYHAPFSEIMYLDVKDLTDYYNVWYCLNRGARKVHSLIMEDQQKFKDGSREGFSSIDLNSSTGIWYFQPWCYEPFHRFCGRIYSLFEKWSHGFTIPQGTRALADRLDYNGSRLCQAIPVPASAWSSNDEALSIAVSGALQNGRTICEMAINAFLQFESVFDKYLLMRGIDPRALKDRAFSLSGSDFVDTKEIKLLHENAPVQKASVEEGNFSSGTQWDMSWLKYSQRHESDLFTIVTAEKTGKNRNNQMTVQTSVEVSVEPTEEYSTKRDILWKYYQSLFVSNGFGYVYSNKSFDSTFPFDGKKTGLFIQFLASFQKNVNQLREFNNGKLDENTRKACDSARILSTNLLLKDRPLETFPAYRALRGKLIASFPQ